MTIAALLAWLSPVAYLHLETHVVPPRWLAYPFSIAPYVTGMALLIELGLALRHPWQSGTFRATLHLAACALVYLVVGRAAPWSLLALLPVLALLGRSEPEGRVRISALVLGSGVGFVHLARWGGSFGCNERPATCTARVAEEALVHHELSIAVLAVAAIGFVSGLRDQRTRLYAGAGAVLSAGAAGLELLGGEAARQVRWAIRTGGQLPLEWSVDELAALATWVEWLTIVAFTGLAASWVLLPLLRHRSALAIPGLAPTLIVAAALAGFARAPFRIPSFGPEPGVELPVAHGSGSSEGPFGAVEDRGGGTHAIVIEADGRALSYYGRRPVDELRFRRNAQVVIYADRRAPVQRMLQTAQRVLDQMGVVWLATAAPVDPGVAPPGHAARIRWPFAAMLQPRLRWRRIDLLRSCGSCPYPLPGESVGHYLPRGNTSCALHLSIPLPARSPSVRAPLGDVPHLTSDEPREDGVGPAAALVGLALALLLFVRRADRALSALGGHPTPGSAPRGQAPVHPPWLRDEEATHDWPIGGSPYRDQERFRGPANRRAALLALVRRVWRSLAEALRAGAMWMGLPLLAVVIYGLIFS